MNPKKRIIVVEDHRMTIDLLLDPRVIGGTHQGFQHEISVAETIAEARSLIKSGKYDLAMFDQNLPDGRSSESLMQEFMAENPHSEIIVMSGRPEEIAAQLEVGKEKAHPMPKPFKIKAMQDLVVALLRKTSPPPNQPPAA